MSRKVLISLIIILSALGVEAQTPLVDRFKPTDSYGYKPFTTGDENLPVG